MAVKDISYFKNKFKTGYVITETDYADWLDSFRHVGDPIVLSDTTGLNDILQAYLKKTDDIAAAQVAGLIDKINQLTANFLTTGSSIEISQVASLAETLGTFVSGETVNQLIMNALGTYDIHLSPTGTWVIGGNDTGVQAHGDEWEISADTGTWLKNGADTGISAVPVMPQVVTDYNNNISGARDGSNTLFRSSVPFDPETLKVYRGGLRLSVGYDYSFVDDPRGVNFNAAVVVDELLLFEYEKI